MESIDTEMFLIPLAGANGTDAAAQTITKRSWQSLVEGFVDLSEFVGILIRQAKDFLNNQRVSLFKLC